MQDTWTEKEKEKAAAALKERYGFLDVDFEGLKEWQKRGIQDFTKTNSSERGQHKILSLIDEIHNLIPDEQEEARYIAHAARNDFWLGLHDDVITDTVIVNDGYDKLQNLVKYPLPDEVKKDIVRLTDELYFLDDEKTVRFMDNAFHDMAEILDIQKKDISLNGQIKLALGDRNNWKYGNTAQAHYEPETKTMYLMAPNVGAFLHEWAHAFDYARGERYCKEKRIDKTFRTEADKSFQRFVHFHAPNYECACKKSNLDDASYPSEMFAYAFSQFAKERLTKTAGKYPAYDERILQGELNGRAIELHPIPEGAEKDALLAELDRILQNEKEHGILSH